VSRGRESAEALRAAARALCVVASSAVFAFSTPSTCAAPSFSLFSLPSMGRLSSQ